MNNITFHRLKDSKSVFLSDYYVPIIDQIPADPSTMLTAIIEATRLTEQAGQSITIFTADQQLYKIMIDNMVAA